MIEYKVKDRSIYMASIKPGKHDSKVSVNFWLLTLGISDKNLIIFIMVQIDTEN